MNEIRNNPNVGKTSNDQHLTEIKSNKDIVNASIPTKVTISGQVDVQQLTKIVNEAIDDLSGKVDPSAKNKPKAGDLLSSVFDAIMKGVDMGGLIDLMVEQLMAEKAKSGKDGDAVPVGVKAKLNFLQALSAKLMKINELAQSITGDMKLDQKDLIDGVDGDMKNLLNEMLILIMDNMDIAEEVFAEIKNKQDSH